MHDKVRMSTPDLPTWSTQKESFEHDLHVFALGLVSLAGCQVQDRSHLKTAAETMQVPSLAELLSRPSVPLSVSACGPRPWHTFELSKRLSNVVPLHTLHRPFELHLTIVCSLYLFRSFSLQPSFGPGPCLGRAC